MNRRPDARTLLFERIRTSAPKFVHVTGVPYAVALEIAEDPTRIDHVLMTFEAPPFGRLIAAVNTTSRLNRDAGFDARVRLAIVRSTWTEKPMPGLEECAGLDYAKLTKGADVVWEHLERDTLSELLIAKAKIAVRVEVWGELYGRSAIGVHQIHSRRASTAVATDVKNRDGALKFYFAEENAAELLLFKFDGQ